MMAITLPRHAMMPHATLLFRAAMPRHCHIAALLRVIISAMLRAIA